MRDITKPESRKIIETGTLTGAAGVVVAVLVMQAFAFNMIMDGVMSVILVGVGYFACWIRQRIRK